MIIFYKWTEILKFIEHVGFLIELDPTREEKNKEGSSGSNNYFYLLLINKHKNHTIIRFMLFYYIKSINLITKSHYNVGYENRASNKKQKKRVEHHSATLGRTRSNKCQYAL